MPTIDYIVWAIWEVRPPNAPPVINGSLCKYVTQQPKGATLSFTVIPYMALEWGTQTNIDNGM